MCGVNAHPGPMTFSHAAADPVKVEAFYLPKRDYAREELLRSFRMRDSRRAEKGGGEMSKSGKWGASGKWGGDRETVSILTGGMNNMDSPGVFRVKLMMKVLGCLLPREKNSLLPWIFPMSKKAALAWSATLVYC